MTNLESSLVTSIVALVAIIIGGFLGGLSKVSTTFCDFRHKEFEKLMISLINGVTERLDRIEEHLNGYFGEKK